MSAEDSLSRVTIECVDRLRALVPDEPFDELFTRFDGLPGADTPDQAVRTQAVAWLVGYLEGVADAQNVTKLELLDELGVLT